MKEICRICARELCGNQRRWIFHTTTKLNLQVLLSHVLGKDVSRDGKGEFACSKCAFMLDRIYRFDTVIARIEALSIERLQKLLLEKERLKFCIASMYRKNNDDPSTEAKVGNGTVDMSSLPDVRYTALLQEDFAYSGFECWAENEDQTQEAHSCHTSEGPGNRPRRCRGCAALRVADSDYEAICKVPRKVARSISYGASTRWSTSICTEEPALSEVGPPDLSSTKGPADGESMEEGTPGSSVESLDATVQASLPQQRDEEPERGSKELPKCDCCSDDQAIQYTCGHKLELALNMIKGFDYKPIQSPRGSKLPIPVKSSPPGTKPGHLMADGTSPNFLNRPVKSLSKTPVGCSPEISELQELWDDLYEDYLPLRFQNITEEPVQQQELNSNEATMTQPCVPDSHLAELQDKIEQTEAANKILQEKMNEMSCQLKSAREASQRQDCTIQNLSQSLKSRESETEELYQVIEGQKDTMTKLRDMLHRSQLGQLQPLEGGSPAQQQLALLDLQNALFCSQLEVQKFQRASRRKERLLEDAKRNLQFMEATAQGLEQQTEAARTHNQELRSALQQVQEDLRSRNKQLHLLEGTRCRETQAQEQSIHRLNHSLRQKDQLLQEYRELMQDQNNAERSLEANEMMLEKLRRRIQDRDVALERAIDEKFCALEEKEKELHKLQLAVRERDHDLERLRSVLSSNEATIQSMESLLQAKSLELEQLSVTCHNRQWLEGEMKRKFSHWQKEQEGIVQQLQTSLHDRNKEVEDLSATLFCKLGPGQSEVAKELCLRLQRKERMLQDLLGERNKQALEHEMEIQDLLQSMSTREKESQLALGKMVQALMERSAEVQTLRQHIGGKNLGFSTSQLAEATTSIGCHHEERPVQESMHENIKDKLNSGTAKGDTSTSRPQSGNMEASAELEKELIHAKEELELITRKERESRMELSALQSMVTVQAEELQVQAADMESLTRNMQIKEDLIKDLQMQLVDPEDIPAVQRLTQEVLILREKVASAESQGQETTENRRHQLLQVMEGLVEERAQLNEALQAERQLYSSLVESHTPLGSSSERDQALQVELEGARVLRVRLEEALGRSLERLSKLETLAAFGGTAVGEDTEDTSTDFTDSIEEEATHSNTQQQVNSQGLLSNNGSLEQSSLQGSTHHLRSQLEQCKQRYQDLQEKLLVSEATVQILASQLEQYQALFREPGVKQDSKQVQVDLQDLGYETCGRSENEAEREETTSPECEEHDVFSDTKLTEGLHSQHNSLGSPVTSSPLKKPLGNQKDFVDYGKSEDIAVLQQHISDLKARLKNSDKVIQNLKCRVRSSSITSDYASSLERPKKVKLKGDDPTSSPSHSLTDEDEGWQSDGMGVFSPPEMQAREDLEKLIQRVSLLEAQLPKSQMEGKLAVELKSATWPGKYDFLIQAQARELSHLRQKIREGRGVCHILTHNLRDIVKSFEDILRGTDIDYYLGQSFREQLVQGSQVAERLTKKLSTKDQGKADNPSNHEILALRLSKELQDKEKVIEVLQSKLDSRSLTPSSSHTFFDAHRPPSSTSFLSDEMEASSDTDVASECTQYEEDCADKAPPNLLDSIHHSSKNAAPSSKPSSATTCHGVKKKSSSIPATMPSSQKPKEASQAYAGLYFNSIPKPAGIHQPPLSSTPSIFLPFGPPPPAAPPLLDCCGTSVLSLAEAQQELQMLQKQLGESISPTTPTMPAPLPSNPAEVGSPHCLHTPHCTSEFHPLGISAELCRSANSGPLSKSGLWETIRPQKGTAFGDLSSNSAVCHPRSKLAGADLLEEHLSEIRNLRQRLEESICINDRLREQLEDRLNSATRAAGSSCSIHMPSLESVSQLGNENRNLLAEKQNLQAQLSHLSKEHSRELERLREALLASHTRLQELEATLERQKAEQWQMAEELKEKQQVILQFQEEKLSLQDKNNRLQHKIILLQQQSEENQRLIQSLQSELQVYVTLYGNSKQVLKASSWDIYRQGSLSSDLSTLVAEVRALRSQLEYSIQVNNSLRQQLEQKLEGSPGKAALSSSCMTQDFPATSPGNKWQFFQDSLSSPPVRDIDMNVPTSGYSTATSSTLDSETSPFQRTKELGLDVSPGKKTPSVLEGDAPDGSFANKHGRHMIGHIDDFSALKQQLLEGKLLVHKMVSLLQVTLNSPALQSTEILISGSIHQLWGKTKTLHQILEESDALLTMFWRAALPSTNRPTLQKKAEESMKGEILALKTKLSEQENLLKNTNECLKTTKLEKENLEQFIVKQLTRTHDVLKKARRNLEATSQRVPPVTQVM
ncbi:myomegalin isoform X7 [Notamacropus eugenii]|uniref:myomegalin isoform X7 n=1 Tax=Notamacropus eugenii TaxID=9315 RepID=UPI003B66DF70